jgi:hypothetical protein
MILALPLLLTTLRLVMGDIRIILRIALTAKREQVAHRMSENVPGVGYTSVGKS